MTPFPVILGKQQRCRNATVLQVGRCRDCLPDYLQVVVLKCRGTGSPLRRLAALARLARAQHRGRLGHKDRTSSSVSATAASVRADARHFCCRTNLVDAGAFLDRTTWKWALGCSMNPNASEALFLILAFVQKKKIHSRPYMTADHYCSRAASWDVPTMSKAIQGSWATNPRSSLVEIGQRNCKAVSKIRMYVDQAHLALLPCLPDVIV